MSEFAPASDAHPCLDCGACCATYRVSFYWADAEAHGLPAALTQPLTPWHACMAGTQAREPRCVALDGEIGRTVACRVYDQRPSPCRELQPGEDKCQRARLRHALPPLALHDGIVLPGVASVVPDAPGVSVAPIVPGCPVVAPPVVAAAGGDGPAAADPTN